MIHGGEPRTSIGSLLSPVCGYTLTLSSDMSQVSSGLSTFEFLADIVP